MQSPIHEGYEYQDYFTVSIILQLMLKQTDAEIIIDRKGLWEIRPEIPGRFSA